MKIELEDLRILLIRRKEFLEKSLMENNFSSISKDKIQERLKEIDKEEKKLKNNRIK